MKLFQSTEAITELTARDVFAMAALIATGAATHVPPERVVREAYVVADLMLKARERRPT